MLTLLARILLVLTTSAPTDVTHDRAHHACEVLVYAVVAPEAVDDDCTLLGEVVSDALCRDEPGQRLFSDWSALPDPPLPWCPGNPDAVRPR